MAAMSCRHGKDDMEILGVEKFGACGPRSTAARASDWHFGQCRFAQRVVRRCARDRSWSHCSTMAAEGGGAAALDRGHDAPLRGRQRGAVLLTIGVAVAAEHVRHLRASGDPSTPAVRSAGGRRASPPAGRDAGAGPAGSTSRTPCWSRCADSGRWSRGCDGRAAVESCGRRCRLPADGPRMRVAANAA